MKRVFIILALAIAAISSYAQNPSDGTLKFLGIPVDGTKEAMISQLKAKDFRYNSYDDLLYGQFNGKDAEIHVGTNHGVVDRVFVVLNGWPHAFYYCYSRYWNISEPNLKIEMKKVYEVPKVEGKRNDLVQRRWA